MVGQITMAGRWMMDGMSRIAAQQRTIANKTQRDPIRFRWLLVF
jgi:hypothetical protein